MYIPASTWFTTATKMETIKTRLRGRAGAILLAIVLRRGTRCAAGRPKLQNGESKLGWKASSPHRLGWLNLLVHLQNGYVRLHKPLVYQGNSSPSMLENLNAHSGYRATVGVSRTIVGSHYVFSAKDQVRFDLGPYDHTKPLCIDPILHYFIIHGRRCF